MHLAERSSINGLRKVEQLRISLKEDVQSGKLTTGLEKYVLVHNALPEIDLEEVDPSVELFGKKLGFPLIISSMVGGIEEARAINKMLARAAQAFRIGMAVGSQRTAIENDDVAETFEVRDVAPDILLFANLGAVQLNNGFGLDECKRAVEMIEADGLILHLNPLQEALQEEGNSNFRGLLKRIAAVCEGIGVPVIVKEVGWGISRSVAQKLVEAGVSGIDVAGCGGTSWSRIEGLRSNNPMMKEIALVFDCWGIPTSESIKMVREVATDIPVIASGGLRTGVDIAKAIALGADAAGIAMPLLKAAVASFDALMWQLERIKRELLISMFCVGVAKIAELKNAELIRLST